MSKVYVLMAESTYANAFNVPYPVAVLSSKREATKECERRNAKAQQRNYYVRPADDLMAGEGK